MFHNRLPSFIGLYLTRNVKRNAIPHSTGICFQYVNHTVYWDYVCILDSGVLNSFDDSKTQTISVHLGCEERETTDCTLI